MSKPQVTANFLPAVQHPVENDEAAWSRHVNEEGFIYYYNEVTGESSWLEPCFICGEPSAQYCLDCKKAFCSKDFDAYHLVKVQDGAFHKGVSKQPSEEYLTQHVDELQAGEDYCVECCRRAATRMCMECWDAYCNKCFPLVHHVGYLKAHKAAAYSRAKCNWMKIRKPKNEPDLYRNGKTGEITAEMPEEFKSELERSLESNLSSHEATLAANQELIQRLRAECERSKQQRDDLLRKQTQVADDDPDPLAGKPGVGVGVGAGTKK